MNKLSVGIFLEHGFDQTTGGGFSYYQSLVEAIDRYNFDQRLEIKFYSIAADISAPFNKPVIRIHPSRDLSKKNKLKRKINIHFIGWLAKSLHIFRNLNRKLTADFKKSYDLAVEKQLKDNQIDLLFYLNTDSRTLNYPFITTHWDNGHRSMFCFPEVSMNTTFDWRENYFKNTLGKAFAIFCESIAGRDELVRYSGINPARIFIVPLFPGKVTELEVSKEEELGQLAKYELSRKKFFFYPAQFWSHKNHYNLLIAFKKISEQYPDIKMVFSGSDKGNLKYIETVIKDLGLENKVVITGFVSFEAIHSLYRQAIALVMPTFLGPTNMPLLEAEKIGCPVICSDFEGHREMLGENAWYIQPDDPVTIYEALHYHLMHSVIAEPRRNSVFNIENAVQKIESHLLSLISKRKTFGVNFQQF